MSEHVSLDPSQHAVLALATGLSAAVLGAPGSGKTTTAVEFVAEQVARNGIDPEDVLVLAPNRATATALRDRLAVRIGRPTNGPIARTANSIAFQLVRQASEGDVALLTGAEHDRVIDDLLEGALDEGRGPAWPEHLSPEVRRLRGFRTELRDLVMRTAEFGIDPAELARAGRATERPEWSAAAEFLVEYSDVKDQALVGRFDSAELSAFAARLLLDTTPDDAPRVLGGLARVRLIVVDDAQEATESVIALLRGFAARGAAIVAFGDPDVGVNGFRGGRADLLGSLGTTLGLGDADRFVLEHIYRGRPAIRALVAEVSGHIGAALAGPQRRAALVASPDEPGAAVVRIDAPSHAAECGRIAALLRERHLLGDVPWSQMTVVARSGADIAGIERALALVDVPTRGSVARSALRDEPGARPLLTAAALVLGRHELDAPLAAEMLLGPLGSLDGVGLRRLRLALRQRELGAGGTRTSDELLVRGLADPDLLAEIDAPSARRAARLGRTLRSASAVAAASGSIEDVLWALWEGSGLAEAWGAQASGHGVLAEEANRALDGAVALFSSAQRFVERTPDAPARRFVDDVLGADVPEDSLAPQRGGEHVFVTTPPGLIGRSFDTVVIAGLQSGVWPNLRPRGSLLHADLLPDVVHALRERAPLPDVIRPVDDRARVRADELRLFALAASRAERLLVLTCTSNDDEQPSPLMRFAPVDAPIARSRPLHLRGLVGALRRELAATGDRSAASALGTLARENVAGADPAEWYGLAAPSTTAPLVDLDGDPEATVSISPSQIEKAEESPLAWFVDQMASPPRGVAASLGTLVHAVVESAADSGDIDAETLDRHVDDRWGELRFEADWLAEREREKVRRMTRGAAEYLAQFADDTKVLVSSESSFTIEFDQFVVRGTIDRVERSGDGTLVIVDLKTGKSVPAIKGMSENAQLGAYQLAERDGVIDVGGEGAQPGGAKLVFLARPDKGMAYTERAQQAFSDEELDAFRERVRGIGRTMAASHFEAHEPSGARPHLSAWQIRVHLVKAVSA
ncbi:ATP-dependent helicase [Agromyces atrinae]|uniref:ATP-dependent DNA helicase n=1 Tax=Agromyces atrinae TaxID=592376 RepID=UPI001F5737C1|nr:ATP-dependent DNA helicase [Agromyces atrinae]MCI2959189.1 ATP-dependent helicase [Agromyces atrinae]